MPAPPRRRLTLLDLMVALAALTTAVAASAGFYRWLNPVSSFWEIPRANFAAFADVVLFAADLIFFAWPFLIAATAALAAIRFHGARPRRARLLRQPGAVACLTVLGYLAASAPVVWPLREAAFLRVPSLPLLLARPDRLDLALELGRAQAGVGYAVASAWLVLALGGRWRPERSWIDRLGRLLGVAWIVWSVSYTICPRI